MAMGLEEITLHSSSLKYFFSLFSEKLERSRLSAKLYDFIFFFLKFVFSLLYFF